MENGRRRKEREVNDRDKKMIDSTAVQSHFMLGAYICVTRIHPHGIMSNKYTYFDGRKHNTD